MGFSALRLGLSISAVVVFAYVVACGSDDSGDGASAVPEGGLFPTPEASASSSSGTSGTPGGTCGADGVTGGFAGSQTIMVDGTARTYELFVPTNYDGMTTYPLAFVFHGDGGTGAGIRGSFGIEATSGGGAIFVYPDGLDQTWDIDDSGLLKDTAFIDAVAADLAKTHCADPQHFFAVGFSKGAYFVNQLACVSTSNFRGVVSFEGGGPFYVDGIPGMKFDDSGNLVCPAPPLAALQVQGTADTTVPPRTTISSFPGSFRSVTRGDRRRPPGMIFLASRARSRSSEKVDACRSLESEYFLEPARAIPRRAHGPHRQAVRVLA